MSPLSDKSMNLTSEVFFWLVPSFLTLLLAFPSPEPSFQNSPIQFHWLPWIHSSNDLNPNSPPCPLCQMYSKPFSKSYFCPVFSSPFGDITAFQPIFGKKVYFLFKQVWVTALHLMIKDSPKLAPLWLWANYMKPDGRSPDTHSERVHGPWTNWQVTNLGRQENDDTNKTQGSAMS